MRAHNLYLIPLFMLTACGMESPTWMPSGDAYHNDRYKAQPGPEAETLGYEYTAERNDRIGRMWAAVARNLVNDVEAQTGMTAQPLYVEKAVNSNAFNLSLDHALREELRARNYILADGKEGNIVLRYQAFAPKDEGKSVAATYNDDEGRDTMRKPWNPDEAREFAFVLTLLKDGQVAGEVRRTEVLPAYGYKVGEGGVIPSQRRGNGPDSNMQTPPGDKKWFRLGAPLPKGY